MNIIGEVEGRTCVIMDDIVDTAGTLCKAAQALKENGAKRVMAYCTHAVLSGPAISASTNPISTSWWSPTPSRCPTRPGLQAASAPCRSPPAGRHHAADQQRRIRQLAVLRVSRQVFEPVGFPAGFFTPVWSRTGINLEYRA